MKLRNPWGREGWTGKQIPQDLADKLGQLSHGEFYMELNDYLKFISYTNICKYNDDDIFSYGFKNSPVPELNFFEFVIDQSFINSNPSGFEILVNQLGERLKFRKRNKGFQFNPSWFSIMLCRKDEDKKFKLPFYFVKSSVSTNYQIHLAIEASLLRPG